MTLMWLLNQNWLLMQWDAPHLISITEHAANVKHHWKANSNVAFNLADDAILASLLKSPAKRKYYTIYFCTPLHGLTGTDSVKRYHTWVVWYR